MRLRLRPRPVENESKERLCMLIVDASQVTHTLRTSPLLEFVRDSRTFDRSWNAKGRTRLRMRPRYQLGNVNSPQCDVPPVPVPRLSEASPLGHRL